VGLRGAALRSPQLWLPLSRAQSVRPQWVLQDLLWIAEEGLVAPLPDNWSEHVDHQVCA
jgi:hypothetical protein